MSKEKKARMNERSKSRKMSDKEKKRKPLINRWKRRRRWW